MKNAFIFFFMLKALLVLKMLKAFVLTSQTGQQISRIHVLPNLKKQSQPDNEIWSVNKKITHFSGKIIHKMWWRTQSQTFVKIRVYLWTVSLKCCTFVLILCSSRGPSKYIKTNDLTTFVILYKAFMKNKKRFATSLLASFSAQFLKENISCIILY